MSISLNAFRSEYKLRFNTGIYLCTVRNLVRDVSDPLNSRVSYDFNVLLPTYGNNLQRDLVWTLFQKQQLIVSLLMGRTIPKCVIVETDDRKKREVIDGKQRLTTLISFVNNEFPIIYEGVEYFLKDFPEYMVAEIMGYIITADVYYSYGTDSSDEDFICDDAKIDLFARVNFSGTPQDESHISNIKTLKF